MLRFRIPENSILDQMRLKDMPARLGNDILVCAVERNHEIIIPSGSFTLQASDIVSLIASRKMRLSFSRRSA